MTRFIAAVAALLLSLPALAAPDRAGPPGRPGRVHDPATVQTVSGEVLEVRTHERQGGRGVHLRLSTAEGPVDVHLGPAWWLEKQPVQVAKGDKVEVTGSRVAVEGRPALIAQAVKKGEAELSLRDAAGVPAWSGGPGAPGGKGR